MRKNGYVLFFIFMVLFTGFSSTTASPPARIVGGVVSNAVSGLVKWLWSMKATSKTAVPRSSMVKYESGYIVETVFDGSKLGIEPYSVEVSPSGELLVLDSANSNLYRISQPLSLYSRPKLIAGSPEGYSGHVDGKQREARLSSPKGLTVDDRGNVYIADTINMAIRKISDTGVTTIAGGNWGKGGGHIDGPSEDAKFSTDFDVVYVGSSCSLLVIDRGNQAIREIQLHYDDCAYQYESGFPLGVAVLAAAGFIGYMMALLQRRVSRMFSSQIDPLNPRKLDFSSSPYQKPVKSSVRPPLIPTEDEQERQEEGLFGSLGKLFVNAGSAVTEIIGGLFSFRKKPVSHQNQHMYQQQQRRPNVWPVQESFVIPDEDEPPSLDTRSPTPRKTYAFMAKEPERTNHFRQSRAYYNGWNGDFQQHQQQQQHHQRHYSPGTQTYYEQSCESTNEIVFGAVQEQDGRREAVVIKAVDYGDPKYDHHNIRSRINYMGYNSGY
ncbi:hypothetical protein IFM89_032141 [Coptis chinensis]|uniref:NHL repeat-containing protein n=1 Tax=Coptis chinensis TaxID=261450 RepID=A0A835J107_9MAGN|nr:hypothetical protein IFM89_032141 [Coptis chinensis]